jgi:hypothetical protein
MIKFLFVLFLVSLILVLFFNYRRNSSHSQGHQLGGDGRIATFSRFFYTPEEAMPFFSKLDATYKQDHRLSEVYNTPGPLRLIMGRPYRRYRSQDGSWAGPWEFPEYVHPECLKQAALICHEPVVTLIRTEMGKRSGMGVVSPKDVIHTSKCFDHEFSKCSGDLKVRTDWDSVIYS